MTADIFKYRHLKTTVVALLVVVALLSTAAYIFWPYLSAFGNLDSIKEIVSSAGPWGPVVFLIMQVAQVVFAPIPGHVVGFVGGLLFGTPWGTLYSMIGTTIGFATVFILARKLGRPLVEHFVSDKNLNKFDYLAKTKGVWILLIAFLLPVIPDAMAGYIAGLSPIRIRTLLLVSVIGRFPGIFVLSYAGGETANANYTFVAVMFVAFVIVLGIAYLKREKLEHLAERFASKK